MKAHTGRGAVAVAAALGMVVASLVVAPAAQAADATDQMATPAAKKVATWKRLKSGTTQQISSVDYKGSTVAFVTSGGQIFSGPANGPYTKHVDAPGTFFTEVSLNPSGTRGTAVASGEAQLYVYDGTTWKPKDLSTSSIEARAYRDQCTTSAGRLALGPVVDATLTGVAWSSNTVGYVVGAKKSLSYDTHQQYVLRTTDGGATWHDQQNRRDGTCLLDSSYRVLDVLTTPGLVWFTHDHNHGGRLMMSNNNAATVSQAAGSTRLRMLAIDPKNTQRQSSASNTGASYTQWRSTADLWQDHIYVGYRYGVGHDTTKNIEDVKASPNGWFYVVGDDGLIDRTRNGSDAEAVPAPKALRNTDWKSIAFANNSRAVIGGANGALAISTTLNLAAPGTVPKLDEKAPVKGKGLVKAKKKKQYVLRAKGKLFPPAGVTRKQACKGTVVLTVKGKNKTGKFRNIIKKKAKVKKNCTYNKKIVVKGKNFKKMAKVKKVRLVVKFQGNKVMAPMKSVYKVRLVR